VNCNAIGIGSRSESDWFAFGIWSVRVRNLIGSRSEYDWVAFGI
jgi:hypothetical protein